VIVWWDEEVVRVGVPTSGGAKVNFLQGYHQFYLAVKSWSWGHDLSRFCSVSLANNFVSIHMFGLQES